MPYHLATPQCPSFQWEKSKGLGLSPNPLLSGVGKGTRTLDTRNHNPVLYPTELHPPDTRYPALTEHGTPEGIRTPGLLLRRQLLYPTELLAHTYGAGDENRTRIPSLEGWCPGHCATPAYRAICSPTPQQIVSLDIIAWFPRFVNNFPEKFYFLFYRAGLPPSCPVCNALPDAVYASALHRVRPSLMVSNT